MTGKKATILSVIVVTVGMSLARGTTVVDRTPEGIFVGRIVLPDTIRFSPKTLDKLTCFAPTAQRPFYEIAIPIGNWDGGPGASISNITINGVRCYPPSSSGVYSDGLAHVYKERSWITQKNREAKNVIILAKALWHDNERIEAKVEISSPERNETRTIIGKAPPKGGMPEGTVHFESFALSEEAGVDRENEPVEISVSVYPQEVATPDDQGGLANELRLFRIAKNGCHESIPIQIYDKGGVPGVPHRDQSRYLYSSSKTVRFFFFARVGAYQAVPYIITYGSSSPPPSPKPSRILRIEGQSPGFTVSNRFYTCTLNSKCGQIQSIKMNGSENKNVPAFTNHLSRAMHWNPDAYGSNGSWGHTYSWNPPDQTTIAAKGPMLFRITNSGRMAGGTPHLYASVSYTFYADCPYIGVTTMTEVRDPYSASAIRNGEVVVDAHLATHFVWKDKAGKINRIPTLLQAGVLDETAATTQPDIPWVAITNEYDGFGMAAIWTKVDAFHREQGTRPIHRPAYFFYNHHTWGTPLTYFTRAWVYPFAYKGRRPNIMVQPGAVYYERGAFLAFRFKPDSDDYSQVEDVDIVLRQPLVHTMGN
jgi:hypothetical protein